MTDRVSQAVTWCRLLCLLGCAALSLPAGAAAAPPVHGHVAAVLDGDTIVLASGEKVRYLGIDAPEIAHGETPGECYGEEARTENQRWVLHRAVTLVTGHPRHDSHGRLLAYVELQDGTCVNAELLRAGYAHVFWGNDGFERFQEFLACQREALEKSRGMWRECKVATEATYVANRQSRIFHRPRCAFGCQTAPRRRMMFADRWQALAEGFSPCRRCAP